MGNSLLVPGLFALASYNIEPLSSVVVPTPYTHVGAPLGQYFRFKIGLPELSYL